MKSFARVSALSLGLTMVTYPLSFVYGVQLDELNNDALGLIAERTEGESRVALAQTSRLFNKVATRVHLPTIQFIEARQNSISFGSDDVAQREKLVEYVLTLKRLSNLWEHSRDPRRNLMVEVLSQAKDQALRSLSQETVNIIETREQKGLKRDQKFNTVDPKYTAAFQNGSSPLGPLDEWVSYLGGPGNNLYISSAHKGWAALALNSEGNLEFQNKLFSLMKGHEIDTIPKNIKGLILLARATQKNPALAEKILKKALLHHSKPIDPRQGAYLIIEATVPNVRNWDALFANRVRTYAKGLPPCNRIVLLTLLDLSIANSARVTD